MKRKGKKDALPLLEDSFRLSLTLLPFNHHNTSVAAKELALCYYALGRWAEATATADQYIHHAVGKDGVQAKWLTDALALRNRHFAKTNDAMECRATAEIYESLKLSGPAALYDAACYRAVVARSAKFLRAAFR